ncbi:MAG: DUF1385 domain-containing protein [Tissierellia bacterium]|nr:DUF1385 domain-containing protein [Tissierellia bacterium]
MKKVVKKTSIGGQALFEGILMKGPHKTSIVIRKPDGDLEIKFIDTKSLAEKYPIFRKPFFRGIGALYDAFKNGSKAIDYSASFFEEDEEEKEREKNKSKLRRKLEALAFSVGSGLLLVFFLFCFLILPSMISNLFREFIDSSILLNLIEGLIRIIFFFIYVMAISNIKEIKRVFMYHGAEHKTIATYEFGEELTVENARENSMLHPRCGTSFMFNMVIISALVLAFFGWPNPILRAVTRIIMLPILVGITFELNRWMGRSDSNLAKILSKPGLFIQYIGTVKKPTDDMIEVAIEALKAVIPEDDSDQI